MLLSQSRCVLGATVLCVKTNHTRPAQCKNNGFLAARKKNDKELVVHAGGKNKCRAKRAAWPTVFVNWLPSKLRRRSLH